MKEPKGVYRRAGMMVHKADKLTSLSSSTNLIVKQTSLSGTLIYLALWEPLEEGRYLRLQVSAIKSV